MLSEAGNTVPQIAAVTGHSLRSGTTILEKYMARTRHLSDAAIETLRTQSEQNLQTGCKPRHLGRKGERKKVRRDNDLNGAPEEFRTPAPQIRSLIQLLEFTRLFCKLGAFSNPP